MNTVFLETSALIEISFKKTVKGKELSGQFPPNARLVTSSYVLYEAARGFLNNLILLFNRSIQCTEFNQVIEYAAKCRLRGHLSGTVLEEVQHYMKTVWNTQYSTPQGMTLDEHQLIVFRSFLKEVIRRGWKKLKNFAHETINSIGCRTDIGDPFFDKNGHYKHSLKRNKCGLANNCGLMNFVDLNRPTLIQVNSAIDALPVKDAETQKRIPIISSLCAHHAAEFESQWCYGASDALITIESPQMAAVATTNAKHIEPMAKSLGKSVFSA